MDSDEKMWAMFCHLSVLCGFILPFGNVVGPLIIWLVKKDEYPFVNEQGKEAINFQISLIIYAIISAILICIFIGIILLIMLFLFNIIFVIIACIQSYNGEDFKYPLSIPFIS